MFAHRIYPESAYTFRSDALEPRPRDSAGEDDAPRRSRPCPAQPLPPVPFRKAAPLSDTAASAPDATLSARARQLALGLLYPLKPGRLHDAPHLAARIALDTLRRRQGPPEAARIAARPAGYGGIAWDVSTPTVLEAARRGFYPHSHVGPMKWWSPPQRAVMMLDKVHIARRFRRTMRASDAELCFDRDFAAVLDACAAPRPGRTPLTWITPRAKALYLRLHREGHAHSVEIRNAEGGLEGGLFGLTVGPVFSALSMFHTADNASKFAIVGLYHHLAEWGFTAVDHQVMSPWVETLGGTILRRDAFEALLKAPAPAAAAPGAWTALYRPVDTAAWQPSGQSAGEAGARAAA